MLYYNLARSVNEKDIGCNRRTPSGLSYYWQHMSSSSDPKHEDQLNKECIFEYIRLYEFSKLPSRKRCLFLIDVKEEAEAVNSLERIGLELEGRTLTKIETIEGIHHRVDTNLLNIHRDSNYIYSDIMNSVRKYWKGEEISQKSHEILFEGTYRICEIVDFY